MPALGDWQFACPTCRGALAGGHGNRCLRCSARYGLRDGIWDFLLPARARELEPFLSAYRRIRLAEGRGSRHPEHYRALPACEPAHPLAWEWRIRARTHAVIERTVLGELPPRAKILDLGAGVGWLSHRLAESGYLPCAVDVNTDAADGLGAARHYPTVWPRVRAEFDRLPFPEAEADAVIYNAAFHYSTDYAATVREAVRVVRPGGLLAIADSPIYVDPSSGERMLVEQRQYFKARFDDASDSLGHVGFLTWRMLDELGASLGLHWRVRRPWYGPRWWLRRPLARLRGRREPAQFAVIWARVP